MVGLRDLLSGALAGGTGVPDINQLLEVLRQSGGSVDSLSLIPSGGNGRLGTSMQDVTPGVAPLSPGPDYAGRPPDAAPQTPVMSPQPPGLAPLPEPVIPTPPPAAPATPPAAAPAAPAQPAQPAGPTPAQRLAEMFGVPLAQAQALSKLPVYKKYLTNIDAGIVAPPGVTTAGPTSQVATGSPLANAAGAALGQAASAGGSPGPTAAGAAAGALQAKKPAASAGGGLVSKSPQPSAQAPTGLKNASAPAPSGPPGGGLKNMSAPTPQAPPQGPPGANLPELIAQKFGVPFQQAQALSKLPTYRKATLGGW